MDDANRFGLRNTIAQGNFAAIGKLHCIAEQIQQHLNALWQAVEGGLRDAGGVLLRASVRARRPIGLPSRAPPPGRGALPGIPG